MSNSTLNDENYCTEVPKELILGTTIVKADSHKKIIDFSLLSKKLPK